MPKTAALLTSLLFASIASAQGSGCQVNSNTPAILRAEGLAELVADVVITCPGSTSGSANLVVDLSSASDATAAQITSHQLGQLSSEAILLIDEPVPAQVWVTLFPGVQTGPSQITFYNVPTNHKTYRITNIRIDARDLHGANAGAAIHFGSTLAGSVLVGTKAPGVSFTLEDAAGTPAGIDLTQTSLNPALAASSTATTGVLTNQLVFAEGFNQSFRRRNTATTVAAPTAVADQNMPGLNYHTESGFYDSTVTTNGLNSTDLATQGTRLMATFANVPNGVKLFVTTAPLPASAATSARLTVTDPSGSGSYSAVAQTTTIKIGSATVGIAPVTLVNGAGTVAWEVLGSDPASLETYTFGLVVAYSATPTGTAAVTGELGPTSSVATADLNSPLPRFADVSADEASCAATACITATPAGISLSSQIGSAAPTPVNILLASTGAALPYNIALGSGAGVLSLSAASGTTPSTVQLSITPPVVAGVYQYSIVLTSTTAAFAPVTIPVIVTVTGASSGTGALQCTNFNLPPTVRNEGIGEFIGDTLLSCTGGTPTATGAAVTAYDVQLTLTTPVTSRSYATNWSEALLIVDEPTTGLAGSPSALLACNDPTGICAITGTGTGTGTYGGTTGRPNVFPGRISGNAVTFPGVPIDPAPLGSSRILRITNVRTDVSGVAASGSAPGTVSGTVSVGSLTVTKATAPVAYVTPGLASSVRKADDSAAAGSGSTFTTCPSDAPQQAGVVRFSSLFGTAFLPRTAAPFADNDTSPLPVAQSIPGSSLALSTESRFYAPALSAPAVDFTTVGLASAGTRLRAQIDHILAGTRVFVSALPVTFSGGVPSVPPSGPIARLIRDEMLPFIPSTQTNVLDDIPVVELTVSGGSATAVWEVLESNTSSQQNFDFLVWVQATSNTSTSATFTGSLAPAPPAFSDATGHTTSTSLPLPRFAANGSPQPLFSITGCQASLPDLVLTSLTGPVTGNPGGTVSLSTTVLNQGAASAGPFRVEFYFSPTNSFSQGTATDTAGGCTITSLASGASTTCSVSVAVPSSLAPGIWYLAAMADSGNAVPELDETNNSRLADSGPVSMGTALCSLSMAPPAASLPATGTSRPAACPDPTQSTCGFNPEAPLSILVTPSGTCGAWTATSSDPYIIRIVSGATGSGGGTVQIIVLTNVHTTQRAATVTVTSGAASASYSLTQAGSGDNLIYRQVYALYQGLLGRDPDISGFTFWTGLSTIPLGEMADDFLTSPEAFGSDFAVMAAYQAAKGVPPTYAQFATAVSAIRTGSQTVSGLFTSLLNGTFTATNLYQNLLNRPPLSGELASANSAGLAPWFQTLIGYPAGSSIGAANNEFQSTGTFTIDHTNRLYAQMLYYVILSRNPDAGGLSFWIGQANAGGPGILFQGTAGFSARMSILGLGTPNEGFTGSPEFQGLFAN